MRELNFIEDNGRFGISFMSDDKEEANTVMNALHRFISKVSKKEIKENIDDSSKSSVKDYSRCPIDGPSKDVYLNLFSDDRLIELYNNDELEQGYKDYIKKELNRRGVFDLSMTESKNKNDEKNNSKNEEKSNTIIENVKKHELNNKIENKSFEEALEENNEIISFGEDDSNYKIDEECEEDPLSSAIDEYNINNCDYDEDGDKADSEGNKMLFDN